MNRFNVLRWKIKRFLLSHMPVMCFRCGRIFAAKNMTHEINNFGKSVPLCEKCHAELFHPFTK